MTQPPNGRRTALFGHTDVETITLLFNVLGGLQILPNSLPNEEGNWKYVKPEPGCAIVNLGDTTKLWMGGLLRSNLHQVVSAPGKQEDVARYSVAYLVRAEGKTSMRRLAVERSLIEKAGEGE
jgi:isopenicillin N synthase-like dioxygenase